MVHLFSMTLGRRSKGAIWTFLALTVIRLHFTHAFAWVIWGLSSRFFHHHVP